MLLALVSPPVPIAKPIRAATFGAWLFRTRRKSSWLLIETIAEIASAMAVVFQIPLRSAMSLRMPLSSVSVPLRRLAARLSK
jgi:hypothetical protein